MPESMDWVRDDFRSCDVCGRETDAGEWPDWPNGVCEDCDPEILLNYFDCDDCMILESMDNVKIIREKNKPTLLLCNGCYMIRKEESNA